MAKKKNNPTPKKSGEPKGKKVVVTTGQQKKQKIKPTVSKKRTTTRSAVVQNPMDQGELVFGKKNYLVMGIGIAIIFLGMALMAGGGQDPNEWNVDEIYSPIRLTLAPILILLGLGLQIYAIFLKK